MRRCVCRPGGVSRSLAPVPRQRPLLWHAQCLKIEGAKDRSSDREASPDGKFRRVFRRRCGHGSGMERQQSTDTFSIRLELSERKSIMPGGDRTGPVGQGPMTGSGMGVCGGAPAAGFMTPGFGAAGRGVAGRGRGGSRGQGGGRGWRRRNMFYATGLTGWQRAATGPAPAPAAHGDSVVPAAADNQQELAMLKQQADGLAATLGEIQQRIEKLQGRQPTPEPVADRPAG